LKLITGSQLKSSHVKSINLESDANRFNDGVVWKDDLRLRHDSRTEQSSSWTERLRLDTDSRHDRQVLRQVGDDDTNDGQIEHFLR